MNRIELPLTDDDEVRREALRSPTSVRASVLIPWLRLFRITFTKETAAYLLISLILFLALALTAVAQECTKDDCKGIRGQTVGVYTEKTLDLEVKVEHGTIRIWRFWDGDRSQWRWNPQHEGLTESEEKEENRYGELFSRELRRGLRLYKHFGSGLYSFTAPGKGATSTPDELPPAIAHRLQEHNVGYCTNPDEFNREMILQNSTGRRWINGINREWGEFGSKNELTSWGVGNFRVGQALYDGAKIRGYADTYNEQVVTYERDAEGRITEARDLAGNRVRYAYNSEGLLSEVRSVDGVLTRYEYSGRQIIKKTVGDDSGVTDESEKPGAVASTHFTYDSEKRLRSVKNDEGLGSLYDYEYDGRTKLFTQTERRSGNKILETVSDTEGRLKSYSLNGHPQLRVLFLCEDSVIIDKHNRATYFDRDGIGRLKQIIYPDGAWIKFEHMLFNWPEAGKPFNEEGLPWGIKSLSTSAGKIVNYIRSKRGEVLVAEETLPGGEKRTWKFEYDPNGNKTKERLLVGTSEDNANDWIKEWGYDKYGNVAEFKDARGNRWSYKWDSRGNITELTTPRGSVWKYQYNGTKLTYSETPDGYKVSYLYTPRGLLQGIQEQYAAGATAGYLFRYNRRGKLTEVLDPYSRSWKYFYDDASNLIQTIDPDEKRSQSEYDREGRVVRTRDGNGLEVRVEYYDTALPGEIAQQDTPFPPLTIVRYPTFTQEHHRDLRSRLTKQVVKAEGVDSLITEYKYDDEGRLTEVKLPDAGVISYSYDDLSRLTSTTSPGWGTSRIEYKDTERKVRYIDPLGGVNEHHFDQLGQLFRELRADGTSTQYQYDQEGNLSGHLTSNGKFHQFLARGDGLVEQVRIFNTPTPTGVPAETINYRYNLRGDLLEYSDGETTTKYRLDAFGRTLESETNFGAFTKSHGYSYTGNGNRAQYRSAEGLNYLYRWDYADNLLSIDLPNEGIIAFNHDRLKGYEPTSVLLPGGVEKKYSYDNLRRLLRIESVDLADDHLLDLKYQYQPLTSLIRSIDSEHGLYEFGYDEGDRLSRFKAPETEAVTYEYDEFGNRVKTDGATWTYNPNGAVVSTGMSSFEYDAQGNRIEKRAGGQTTSYTFDPSDRLTAVSSPDGSASYGYDPMGQRNWKEVGGERTYFYHTDDGLAGEYRADGTLIRSYLYDPTAPWQSAPLALKTPSSYYYYHTDHLGTPRKLSDRWGATRWAATYDAFGTASVTNSAITNPLRFPGQYFDPETGLHQNLMRDYDPAVGGYLEQDPYGLLMGPNRYGYVYGDPLSLTDPTGEFPHVWVVQGAIWLGFEAWTGFPTYQCIEALAEQRCMTEAAIEACIQTGISTAVAVGTGYASTVAWPVLKPMLGKVFSPVLKHVGPYASRAWTKLDEMLEAFSKRWGDERGSFSTKPTKQLFKPSYDKVKVVGGRKYLRDPETGTWWSKDTAGHGGSAWKMFKEDGKGLRWVADVDELGNTIVGKHKSPQGNFIPFD